MLGIPRQITPSRFGADLQQSMECKLGMLYVPLAIGRRNMGEGFDVLVSWLYGRQVDACCCRCSLRHPQS